MADSAPGSAATIELAPIELDECAPVLDHLPAPVRAPQPLPMERLGRSYGLVLYRTDVRGLDAGKLRVRDVHDYAHVYLNGRRLGTLDRTLKQGEVDLPQPPADAPATLEILIDTLGA